MQALYFIHYGFTILAKKGQKVSNIYICDMQIQDISCHKKKEKPKVFGLKIRFIPRFISCIHGHYTA